MAANIRLIVNSICDSTVKILITLSITATVIRAEWIECERGEGGGEEGGWKGREGARAGE